MKRRPSGTKMEIIDCQTKDYGIYAIMTDQEKIDLLNQVACFLGNQSIAYRKEYCNWSIVSTLTRHGCGYSSAICEALGIDPDSHEWESPKQEKLL